VALLVISVSGCSLFQRSPAEPVQSVPTEVSPSTTVGSTAAARVPAVQVATPSRTTAAPADAPAPPAVPGYSLTNSSVSVQRRFQSVASQFRGVFSGLTARTIVKGRQQVGTVVLLGLDPGLVGNNQAERRLVPGMVKGMSGQGAKVTTKKVRGLDVAVATTKATNIVAWYRSGTVVLVLANGTDPAQSLTFAKAYLAAR
jgi:hypothetical protein